MKIKAGHGWQIINGLTVTGAKGLTTAPADHADNDFNAPIDVTPVIKAANTRARASCALWADEHADLIKREREKPGIGNWRQTVARLYDALPEAEQRIWEDKAQALKAKGLEVVLVDYYE